MSLAPLLVGVLAAAAVLLAPAPGAALRLGAPPAPARSPLAVALRRRRRPRPVAGGGELPLLLDLLAAATRAGAPPGDALDAALDAVAEGCGADAPAWPQLRRVRAQLLLGAAPEVAWAGADASLHPLRDPLLLSAATGVPAADLLGAAATQLRREERRAAEVAAARLGPLLVLPLGLCTLPAFVLLGVVPVLLSLAADVLTH